VQVGGGGEENARYWGALNSIRQLREEIYGRSVPLDDDQDGYSALLLGVVILGLGAVGAAGLALATMLGGPPERWLEWLIFAILSAVPALLLVGGVWALVCRRVHLRKIQAYGERRPAHDGRRSVLAALADRWDGEAGSGGIRSACLFLIDHWPDQAPQMVIGPIGRERNDRLTLTATAYGQPVLMQIIDLLEPIGDFSSPALAVLVACPLDPASATAEPGETPAGRWLTERGLRIGWNRAGAYALHCGPADALLTVESLEQVAQTLVRLCRTAPAGVPTLEPEPVTRDPSAGPQEVAEHFLRALAARDALGALTYADPLLSAGRPSELTLDEVDEAIDDLRARPIDWRQGRLFQSDDTGTYRFKATFTHRPAAELSVYITLRQGRWLVCGYSVGTKQVIGINHDY
jgi:hypothetical protein